MSDLVVVALFFVWAGCALVWVGRVVADEVAARDARRIDDALNGRSARRRTITRSYTT